MYIQLHMRSSSQVIYQEKGSELFHPIHRSLYIKEILLFSQALLNSQCTFVPGDHVAVPGTSEKISF